MEKVNPQSNYFPFLIDFLFLRVFKKFCFDIDGIPALAERKRKTYENITSAVREGIMTRNEAREEIGLSPVDGGDELYISANLFPLGAESTEEPENPLDEEEVDIYDDELDMEEEEKAEVSIIKEVNTKE